MKSKRRMQVTMSRTLVCVTVRMETSSEHWSAGDVFTVAVMRRRGGLTLKNGCGLSKKAEGKTCHCVYESERCPILVLHGQMSVSIFVCMSGLTATGVSCITVETLPAPSWQYELGLP
eukprot:gnl/TRDRNA2_/TRDRNA2_168921_c0_seq1.p4 gnl/TRDRNA2_/TRDRNA2_168921_c0~~gnl/TRDRNA2_/TRDRNA2_168921_c0_seq1.p4  ORF type:complete len:118 (+),score=6.73 gnl/TRDRNA2_/TRDRNA2_168921_c0_seq1:203-556(+)